METTTLERSRFRARRAPQERVSFAEYMEFERMSEAKHDFVDGVIVPRGYNEERIEMAGASYEHVVICKNLTYVFEATLENTDCQPLGSDMRVEIAPKRLYYYPDLTVLCGNPRITPEESLQNPMLIAEVLSDSTAPLDEGDKFSDYQGISSLMHYVLVDQYKPYLLHFERDTVLDRWNVVGEYASLSDVWRFVINGVAISIPLARIYRGVAFLSAEEG